MGLPCPSAAGAVVYARVKIYGAFVGDESISAAGVSVTTILGLPSSHVDSSSPPQLQAQRQRHTVVARVKTIFLTAAPYRTVDPLQPVWLQVPIVRSSRRSSRKVLSCRYPTLPPLSSDAALKRSAALRRNFLDIGESEHVLTLNQQTRRPSFALIVFHVAWSLEVLCQSLPSKMLALHQTRQQQWRLQNQLQSQRNRQTRCFA